MTKTIDLAEPHESLSEIVSMALAGTEIILAEGSKPLVRLVPVHQISRQRVAGLNRGAMIASDDFDAPLSDELWIGTAK